MLPLKRRLVLIPILAFAAGSLFLLQSSFLRKQPQCKTLHYSYESSEPQLQTVLAVTAFSFGDDLRATRFRFEGGTALYLTHEDNGVAQEVFRGRNLLDDSFAQSLEIAGRYPLADETDDKATNILTLHYSLLGEEKRDQGEWNFLASQVEAAEADQYTLIQASRSSKRENNFLTTIEGLQEMHWQEEKRKSHYRFQLMKIEDEACAYNSLSELIADEKLEKVELPSMRLQLQLKAPPVGL